MGRLFRLSTSVLRGLFVCSSVLVLGWPGARALAQADRHLVVGAPIPRWAELVEPPPPTDASGIETLLDDTQVEIDGRVETDFVRVVYTPHSTPSVEEGSQITIDRPYGTTVLLHHVRRIRAGVAEDVLDARAVRVIQPEERLGEGLYDERQRVIVFLGDVRVGDILDYAYSLRLPSEGLLAHRSSVGGFPTHWMRFRAHWDRGRAIAVRTHALPSTFAVQRDEDAIRIEAREVVEPAWRMDVPAWFDLVGWVELSEFASWSDVVAWALPHYTLDALTPESLPHVPFDRFTAYGDDLDRAGAALRFVADEVRYLGIEVGDRAFVPDRPDEVAARRFGDCKDKALLLVAILRALGIDAAPALVSSDRGHVLDAELPSPYAFDHVIVRAHLAGRDVWMDPTRSDEREPVTELSPLGLERALVLEPGVTGLVDVVDAPPAPELEVEERFVLASGRATLNVVSLARGAEAAIWRAELGRVGEEGVASQLLAAYAEASLDPTPLVPTRLEEASAGALRATEQYTLRRFYVDGVRDISAWPANILPVVEAGRPEVPLALPYPASRVHRVIVEDPAGFRIAPSEERVENAYFQVTRVISVEARTLTIETRIRTRAGHVPPEHLTLYIADSARAQRLLGYELLEDDEADARPRSPAWLLGFCCAFACTGGLALLLLLGVVRALQR